MPPRILLFAASLLGLMAIMPFAVIAWARSEPSPARPIHIVQDMDYQPRFNTQTVNPLFQDNRAMRPQIPGVVASSGGSGSQHYDQGVIDDQWATTLPSGIPMDMSTLERGQARFNIYCSVCHGYAGYGDGIVNERALGLMSNADGPVYGTAWVQAKSVHDPTVREQPIGQIYNTITHGIRNMAGYAAQVPPHDRWAIAAYVKTLQLSQDATLQDVPPEHRGSLNP
jgi:mono/diheme cytochrome c family protein